MDGNTPFVKVDKEDTYEGKSNHYIPTTSGHGKLSNKQMGYNPLFTLNKKSKSDPKMKVEPKEENMDHGKIPGTGEPAQNKFAAAHMDQEQPRRSKRLNKTKWLPTRASKILSLTAAALGMLTVPSHIMAVPNKTEKVSE